MALDEAPFDSFAHFFSATTPSGFAFAAALMRNTSDAEDVVQDAYLEMFKRWDTLRQWPQNRVRGYLRQVIRNKVLNYLRYSGRLGSTIAALTSDASGIEAALSDEEHPVAADDVSGSADVVNLLRHLPPAQRAVIALIIDGYSTREISEFLDTRPDTVSSNLRHARRRLRELVSRYHTPAQMGRRGRPLGFERPQEA
ncbi:RNA polymerase sigma factor [Actinomadura luteofluorescens]|uniref:RNA polymerase sigma factor n=1 Tax=Actinomadura luteofluorescens TaxID=46163 RepID=UPI0021649C5C|nr:sigma-70 family RNA polymerase sigma factor [Actinomadura glauciflava]